MMSNNQCSDMERIEVEGNSKVSIINIPQSLELLPEEILLFIFKYLDDSDLQSLTKVSHQMRRLSGDIILWRYFYHVRNPAMVNSQLFSTRRPNRLDLIRSNIIRGVNARQIRAGSYINGPVMKIMHEAQVKLERNMRQQIVVRSLTARPPLKLMEQKGLMIHSAGREPISSILQPRVVALRRALQRLALNKKLARRRSIGEIIGDGVVMKGVSSVDSASSLARTRVELERRFSEQTINSKIIHRPSASDVERVFDGNTRLIAQMVCPNVKPKIKLFESSAQSQQDGSDDNDGGQAASVENSEKVA